MKKTIKSYTNDILMILFDLMFSVDFRLPGGSGTLSAPFLSITGSLMYLNEATLLNNVKVRYSKEKIYVSLTFCLHPPVVFERKPGLSAPHGEESQSEVSCLSTWTFKALFILSPYSLKELFEPLLSIALLTSLYMSVP